MAEWTKIVKFETMRFKARKIKLPRWVKVRFISGYNYLRLLYLGGPSLSPLFLVEAEDHLWGPAKSSRMAHERSKEPKIGEANCVFQFCLLKLWRSKNWSKSSPQPQIIINSWYIPKRIEPGLKSKPRGYPWKRCISKALVRFFTRSR